MNNREFPVKIQEDKALKSRLPTGHHLQSELDAEIARAYAGYKGEKAVDYYLSILPKSDFRIYRDLYYDDGSPFQIDTLLINPFFSLSIDSKNIDGTTTIQSESGQNVQDYYGEKKRLKSIVAQTKRHHFLLMEWYRKRQFPPIPIVNLVANTSPSGILTADDPFITKNIVNAEMLPTKIEELQKLYTKRIWTPKDLERIHRCLIDENLPPTFNIRKRFKVRDDEISRGVHCPNCGCLCMDRKNRFWECPKCGAKSRTAHEVAIQHYFLLIKPTITVAECCDWLCIDSRHIAKRLLLSMGLAFSGENRGRIYYSPWTRKK